MRQKTPEDRTVHEPHNISIAVALALSDLPIPLPLVIETTASSLDPLTVIYRFQIVDIPDISDFSLKEFSQFNLIVS